MLAPQGGGRALELSEAELTRDMGTFMGTRWDKAGVRCQEEKGRVTFVPGLNGELGDSPQGLWEQGGPTLPLMAQQPLQLRVRERGQHRDVCVFQQRRTGRQQGQAPRTWTLPALLQPGGRERREPTVK